MFCKEFLNSPIITGLPSRVIAGISIAGVLGSLLLISCVLFGFFYRRKKLQTSSLPETYNDDEDHYGQHGYVDTSVEFSFQELATATNDFNISNKIGQGGFGTVYYAQLSGKRAAIKKMDIQASKEFLAELKVHLIGYCVDRFLCLVYEFIENGNLNQHLRGSDRDPLPWLARVQIALDSARGLQYIHELTIPGYIHRDVKSTNILIDENFRGKVGDFGLTVLTELGNARKPRRAGTFGYMPPEFILGYLCFRYAENDDVSPKTDVYAFGVVLYELISAKEAVLETKQIISEFSTHKEKIITLYKTITDLFEDVLSQPDPRDELCKLIDPRLGDNYPLDSIHKMVQLAKACTHENPQLRPSMRSIVIALMTLSSSTENWDEKSSLVNQMASR
ncbi:chitin elicitor receptor kinase 1 [Euphorbia peplus]|nr:chitin elicitor receptor kinase 1 [Euphorbia peplus]